MGKISHQRKVVSLNRNKKVCHRGNEVEFERGAMANIHQRFELHFEPERYHVSRVKPHHNHLQLG